MTEAEWLVCPQTERLWEYLKRAHNVARTKTGKRKLRLWAAACFRAHIGYAERRNAQDPRVPVKREAVDVVERFADGLATREDLDRVDREMLRAMGVPSRFVSTKVEELVSASCIFYLGPEGPSSEEVMRMRVTTFREVFGNPFRPFTLDAARRTPTIESLAQAAYDERQMPSGELAPQRLAVLADALEEAGAPGEMVAHLRSPRSARSRLLRG